MVDETIFADAAKQLFPSLYRVSISILRSDADAQDALQQALEKAWIHREKIVPEKLRAWLMRTLINECRSMQRRAKYVTPVATVNESLAYTPPDSDFADLISGLPESLRIPVLLKYAERYSEKEIAESLRISVAAVKNRLFRARRTLEKELRTEVSFK